MTLNSNYVLSAKLHQALNKKKLSLAFAESCTAGYISVDFTAVSGASNFLDFSIITYSNEAKIKHLGVDADIIEQEGAVSAACAQAMATGLQKLNPVDIALSITGIAGPNGGSPEKPVGTVYLAIADRQLNTQYRHLFLKGGRKNIRRHSVQAAFEFLIQYIENNTFD